MGRLELCFEESVVAPACGPYVLNCLGLTRRSSDEVVADPNHVLAMPVKMTTANTSTGVLRTFPLAEHTCLVLHILIVF